MNARLFVFFALAVAASVHAGAVLELVPDSPGPYHPEQPGQSSGDGGKRPRPADLLRHPVPDASADLHERNIVPPVARPDGTRLVLDTLLARPDPDREDVVHDPAEAVVTTAARALP